MLSSSAVLIGALIGIANAAQPTRTPTRGPTIMPSRAPSVEPTIQPSEAPTQWPTDAWGGWATTSFYTEEDELLIVTGKKTESCIPKYQGTSDVIEFNYKINCGDAVMKFYYYDAADTNCEGEVYGGEPYVETDLYGEFENGLQIGRTRVSDIVYYQLECSPLDAPFSFAPVAEDNSTLYYATEMLYPEVENEADRCATEEMNVFTSYLENRCFHYTMYTPVVNSTQWEGSEYSGKFVSEWSPSEDIRFKRYVGGSCSDWHSDPVVSNLKVINQCNALRGQDEDESSGSFAPGESTTGESTGESTTGESTGVSTGESTGVSTGESTTGESTGVSTGESTTGEEVMSVFDIRISHLTHTLLDTKVERAFAKAKAAKSATAADKQVQEDFSSTYTYAVASGEDTDFINVDDETDVELTNRGAYSMWVNTPEFPTPTAVPTVMPSHPTYRPTPAAGEPTAAPTHQEAYTFSAWMTLKNIDQATWYQKQSNSDSFVQAVAANMHSMNPDAISFGKVRNVHNSDYERKLQLKSTNLRTLDESSSEEVNEVKIDFQVSFVLATVNYHNITDAYDELTGALYDGVIITGLFDHLLQSYSADNGGSLDYVKSVDVGFGEPETWDMTREEHPKNTHSGLIVGVIIGLGVGLSCIAGMYYWVFYASA